MGDRPRGVLVAANQTQFANEHDSRERDHPNKQLHANRRADSSSGTAEMGDEVPLADGPVLHVEIPEFYNMDPSLPAPEFSATIIKAGAAGGTVVAESTGDPIDYTVTSAGAYRAKVHVIPHHLAQWLGGHPDKWIKKFPLIYSNPIYVTE